MCELPILFLQYVFALTISRETNRIADPQNQYFNENLYLASFGISTRKYVQDKYIFKFGITEDVPIGKALSLTGGFRQTTAKVDLPGARVSFGNYKSWGYLSSNIEYGTFFEASHLRQDFIGWGNLFHRINGNWKMEIQAICKTSSCDWHEPLFL